MISSKGVIINP